MSPQKWLIRLLSAVLSVCVLLACAVYVIDPYFHYRVRDNTYFLNSMFVIPGLIKNADYDSIVIGSSMTQCFDMDKFRKELSTNPLKTGFGGFNLASAEGILRSVYDADKAESYYICLDQFLFSQNEEENKLPLYLMDDSIWNDYRYFFGYEAWFRFIPVDVILLLLQSTDVELPQSIQNIMSIDRLGDWRDDFQFGEKYVVDVYLNNENGGVSEVDTKNLLARMTKQFDYFLSAINIDEGSYTFFFPPYSALFWNGAKEQGYLDEYMEFKKYVVSCLDNYENVALFDFQGADFTADLDNYKDITHYSPTINDWMVDCFANGEYKMTQALIDDSIQKVEDNIQVLRGRYSYLFEN